LFLFYEKEDGGIVKAKQATLIPFSDYCPSVSNKGSNTTYNFIVPKIKH
jgi:hypothetical protein